MKRKPLNVQSLLAIMLISIGAAIVSSSDAMAQAPKAESPPAAATEIKSAPLTPVPPAAAPTTEVVENPYGIEALWRQGDFVARGTLIILMIMSVGSWYIGIIKVLEQRRMLKDAKVAGPVGEALIMTALGLAVAVPAVLGYNWLVRRNRVAMEFIRHFGGGVHMSLLGRGGRTRADSES